MPANKSRMVELSMVPPLANELGDQINGTKPKSTVRLMENSAVGPLAVELVRQMNAGVGNCDALSQLGMPTRLAREVATQISGGTPTPIPTPPNGQFVAPNFATYGSSYAIYPTATGYNSLYDVMTNETWVTTLEWDYYATTGTSLNRVYCRVFNHTTKKWGARVRVSDTYLLTVYDMHGVPAICRLANGRKVVFFGNHDTNQPWAYSDINSNSGWTDGAQLANGLSYSRPHVIGNNLYLLGRGLNTLNTGKRKMWMYSADCSSGIPVFNTTPDPIFDANGSINGDAIDRWYGGNTIVENGKITFCGAVADGPDLWRRQVYIGVLDPVAKTVTPLSGGTPDAVPVNFTTMQSKYAVYSHTPPDFGNIPSISRMPDGNLAVLYSVGNGLSLQRLILSPTGSVVAAGATVASIADRYGLGITIFPSATTMRHIYVRDTQGKAWPGPAGVNIGGDILYRESTLAGVMSSEVIAQLADDKAIDTPALVLNGVPEFAYLAYETTGLDANVDQGRGWGYNLLGLTVGDDTLSGADAAAAFVARNAGTPRAGTQAALATYIQVQIASGAWQRTSVEYLWQGLTSTQADANLNIKAATFPAVPTGIVWTSKVGYQGNSATSGQIDSGFTPSTGDPTVHTTTARSYGFGSDTAASDGGVDVGVNFSTLILYNGTNSIARVTETADNGAPGTGLGSFVNSAQGAINGVINKRVAYRNKLLLSTGTTTFPNALVSTATVKFFARGGGTPNYTNRSGYWGMIGGGWGSSMIQRQADALAALKAALAV